ncbi:hypothetical protein evm_014785 [Chilo suppressalis]|nr:hypothetical protein evm_014785 [Chilo suppressalis]
MLDLSISSVLPSGARSFQKTQILIIIKKVAIKVRHLLSFETRCILVNNFPHRYTGGLRVYQKPDSLGLEEMLRQPEGLRQKYLLFEQWGNQGDVWYGEVAQLRNFSDNFQIVVEGIRGKKFTSDIAIDDVAILQGENCTLAESSITTPTAFLRMFT